MATLSTIYGSMMLSSMFLSPLLIKKFGCKWTMVGSMSCYLTFSLANFYANWYSPSPSPTPRQPSLSVCALSTHADHCPLSFYRGTAL